MQFLKTAFQQLLSNSSESIVTLANPQWDAVVFVFLFIVTLFYGLGLTRNKIFSFLLSTYVALALMDSLPYVSSWWVGLKANAELAPGMAFLTVAVFIAAFVFANLVLRKYFPSDTKGTLIYNFLLSLLHVGFVISIILSSFPSEARAAFSPFTQRLFMGEIAQFFWFIIPLLTILLVQNEDTHSEPVEENWRGG